MKKFLMQALPDGGRSTSEDMWSRKRHFSTAYNLWECRFWGQIRNAVTGEGSDMRKLKIVEIKKYDGYS